MNHRRLILSDSMLVTATCSFKLYGKPLSVPASRRLQNLASTMIPTFTAGFVIPDDDGAHLSAFWWEGEDLHRSTLAVASAYQQIRVHHQSFLFSRIADIPLIAFEAESWTRNVLTADYPAFQAYLTERLP